MNLQSQKVGNIVAIIGLVVAILTGIFGLVGSQGAQTPSATVEKEKGSATQAPATPSVGGNVSSPQNVNVTVNPTFNPVINIYPPSAPAAPTVAPGTAPTPTPIVTPKPSDGAGAPRKATTGGQVSSISHNHQDTPFSSFINESVLSGKQRVTLVAARGDDEYVSDIIEALGVPVVRGGFKSVFYAPGSLYDQAMAGNGSGIANLGLPDKIDKIILVHVGKRERKINPWDTNATDMSEKFQISILASKTGTILKSSRLSASGIGYSEAALSASFKESLVKSVEPLKTFLE